MECAQFTTGDSELARRMTVKMETKNAQASVAAWLTYREASAYCGLGRTTLTALVTSGAVPAAKIGKAVRISRTGLDEYMRGRAYTEATQD